MECVKIWAWQLEIKLYETKQHGFVNDSVNTECWGKYPNCSSLFGNSKLSWKGLKCDCDPRSGERGTYFSLATFTKRFTF